MTTETALRDAFVDIIAETFVDHGFSPNHVLIEKLADELVTVCKDVLDLVPSQPQPDPHRKLAVEDPHFLQGTLDSGVTDA